MTLVTTSDYTHDSEDVVTEIRGVHVDGYGRSRRMNLLSCERPWFRAFHFSWLSFFLAFLGWFSIVPALEYLVKDENNDITLKDTKTSGLTSVVATIFVR